MKEYILKPMIYSCFIVMPIFINHNNLLFIVFWIINLFLAIILNIKIKSIPLIVIMYLLVSFFQIGSKEISIFLFIFVEFNFTLIHLIPIFINIFLNEIKDSSCN